MIDLISDTVTVPCPGMRQAMANARVGDDVYGEDPTVVELERFTADLLGKEAALYVLSGTMANLVAACVYASKSPFPEIVLGQNSHVAREEVGGISCVARCSTRQLLLDGSGAYDLSDLSHIMKEEPDIHCPTTCAVFLEDTHGFLGGKCLPESHASLVKTICSSQDVALHCDGARLWNAAVARGQTPAQAAAPFDSVSCCLSKGLGAPVGSILAGSSTFIQHARKVRKMLGGGTRQVGIVAAGGLFALRNNLPSLAIDHRHAKEFANELRQSLCDTRVNVPSPDTNVVLIDLPQEKASSRGLLVSLCLADGVRIGPWGTSKLRAVMHRNITHNQHLLSATIVAKRIREILGNSP